MDPVEHSLRERDAAVGVPREVALAALFMTGNEEDAVYLADVRARIDTWEHRQAELQHARWIADLRKRLG